MVSCRRTIDEARLVSSLCEQYHINIVPDTLQKLSAMPEPVMGLQMEAQRVHVSPQAMSKDFTRLSTLPERVPSEFVWNMDKLDHVDWLDVHPKPV